MSYSASLGTTGMLDPGVDGGAGQSGLTLGTGTGQHGVANLDTSGTNPFVAVWQWLNAPLTTPLSLWTIALIVGAILFATVGWNLVLYHIRIAAEAI